MTIDEKACFDCRNGFCPEHGTNAVKVDLVRPVTWELASGRKLVFVKHHEENLGPLPEEYRSATRPVHPLDFEGTLDNRGPQVCAQCGATDTKMISTRHAGWLCLDVPSCVRRAGEEEAREINSWVDSLPSDIHGTGRCTCGGEGRCAWCQEICQRCQGDGLGNDAWLICDDCNGTGYADGLALSMEERAAKIAAIRAEEADYAALGYPETECARADLDYAAFCVGFASRGIAASVIAYQVRDIGGDIQKDILADTNTVDDNAPDSYK